MDAALKKHVLEKLTAADDDELFSLVQEDIGLYKISKTKNVTDGLSEADFAELKELAEKPNEKDTVSIEKFKKATERWRIQKFRKNAF